MPTELPVDVWLHMLEYPLGRKVFKSLSRTSKTLRDICLPTLYRELSFGTIIIRYDDIKGMADFFLRICERIDSLKRYSYLLDHVRSIYVGNWSAFSQCIEDMRAADGGIMNRSQADINLAGRLCTTAYETMIGFFPCLSHLQRIHIYDCPITPLFHSHIQSNAHLTSLEFSACRISVETLCLLGPSCPLTVKDLTIYDWAQSSFFGSYFTQLLEGCMATLVSLNVPHSHIPNVLAAAADRQLMLRNLTISHDPPDKLNSTTWHLLLSCPELRTLTSYLPDEISILDALPDGALSKLEFVHGPPTLVRALVPGRPVHSIEITGSPWEQSTLPSLDELKKSTAAITTVKVESGSQGMEDFAVFLTSLQNFHQLTHLTISLYSIEEVQTLKAISDAIIKSLHHWPQLRTCRLDDRASGFRSRERDLAATSTECPLGRKGDPGDRGHPSLEELMIFTPSTWAWVGGEGWIRQLMLVDPDEC